MRIAHVKKHVFFIFLISSIVFIAGCQTQQYNTLEKSVSYGYEALATAPLNQFIHKPAAISEQESGFLELKSGREALLMRLTLIEKAQKSLDLQYYIFKDDDTSQLVYWRLYEAAQRGVRVRLLLDDMQSRSDHALARLDTHPNIEIRLFNPHGFRSLRMLSWVTNGAQLNRRMHNKSFTADSVFSIVGGRNIGNEYFAFRSEVEFSDFDMLLAGHTVKQAVQQFDVYWNSEYAVPMEWILPNAQPLKPSEMNAWQEKAQFANKFSYKDYFLTDLQLYKNLQRRHLPLRWGKANLYYDTPQKVDNGNSAILSKLDKLLFEAKKEIVIISPYFVPAKEGSDELVRSAKQGKKITILTNSLASNDVFAVHGWYAKYRKKLLEAGIELWELKAHSQASTERHLIGSRSSLHSKVMMLDKERLFIGSMNLDPRSALYNTEMAVLLEKPDYVQQSVKEFEAQLKHGAYQLILKDKKLRWIDHHTGEVLKDEPHAGHALTFGAWVAGNLPIEKYL